MAKENDKQFSFLEKLTQGLCEGIITAFTLKYNMTWIYKSKLFLNHIESNLPRSNLGVTSLFNDYLNS